MDKKDYQPPLTVDEQLENLKQLGLIIPDYGAAKQFLNDVSYFRLIKAFSIGLKEKNSVYNTGVTFDEIKELYLFNCNFRQLLFPQIERVEINLRCKISNYFSYTYGNFGYEDAANFNNPIHHANFLGKIKNEVEQNRRAPFVSNFQNTYKTGKLPLYALIELFSFGTLSKFYKNMKNADKKAIARMYDVGYKYLESWIEHIAFVRNVCAHYGRVYNINLTITPILYKDYSNISNVRIFATLICLKHILPNDRNWHEFVISVEMLLEKYPHVKKELMGFPSNWKEVLTRT